MKTIKWLSLMLALTACMGTLVACGDDDEGWDGKLYTGTWTSCAMGIYIGGEYTIVPLSDEKVTGHMEINFDGNYEISTPGSHGTATITLWTDDGIQTFTMKYNMEGTAGLQMWGEFLNRRLANVDLVYNATTVPNASETLRWESAIGNEDSGYIDYFFKGKMLYPY